MNDTQTNIEKVVMRRVRIIRILALIISTVMLAIFTSIAALWGIGREVWVAKVFENAPTDLELIEHLPGFFISAFAQTNLVVQALVILTLISFIFLAREIVRALTPVSAKESV